MQDEDTARLRAWGSGDARAGRELFDRLFPAIFRFFTNRVGEAHAEDLTQDTFVALARSAARFDGRASARSYAFVVAKNRLLMFLRSEEASARRAVRLSGSNGEDAVGSPGQLQEDRRWLARALKQLALEDQLLLELHYWEGLRLDEVAVVLGVPLGTAKSKLRRARMRLAEALSNLPPAAATLMSTVTDLPDRIRSLRESLRCDHPTDADS